jgi:hypothetical protein
MGMFGKIKVDRKIPELYKLFGREAQDQVIIPDKYTTAFRAPAHYGCPYLAYDF